MGEYCLYVSRDKTEYIVRIISLDDISFIKADGSKQEWFKNTKLEVEFINDTICDMAQEAEIDTESGDIIYIDNAKTTTELTLEEVKQKLQQCKEEEPNNE